jgi:hypothetical protein
MNAFLHSPVTIGVCVVALFAWVMTLAAIFWPQKTPVHKDDINGYF